MLLQFYPPLARFSAGTPLAPYLRRTKVAGAGMEAGPTAANRAFVKEASMNCSRCASRMFPESSLYYASTDYTPDLGDVQAMNATSWHCVMCGNHIDRIILENRARQAKCLLEQAA
jgi:DNA-directed RNA polymerase subunit RPC12/RpoP